MVSKADAYGQHFTKVVEDLAACVLGETPYLVLEKVVLLAKCLVCVRAPKNLLLIEYPKVAHWLSHESSPRANIFRRDQGEVDHVRQMAALMRSNDWHHDPVSDGTH